MKIHRRPKNDAAPLISMLGLALALTLTCLGTAYAAGEEEHAGSGREHGGHAADEAGHDAHHDINWYYGFAGEDAEIDHPTLLWRKPGMPVPLVAYLINTGLLFWLLYHYGKRPIMDGLKGRREGILKGMEAAASMRAEAEQQLREYEDKLAGIDSEVERIRKEIREAAQVEREHILAEARRRRERMEREAKLLIEQELKAAHQQLVTDTVRSAIASATDLVAQRLTPADHQRLGDEYLQSLESTLKGSIQHRQGGSA